ncbi:MAG: DUF3800 domain-containing protein [Solirubrobacteraceae bacterium]
MSASAFPAIPPRLPVAHPTSTIFLDETGIVHPRDQYFGIGVLKLIEAAPLLRDIQRLRDRFDFREELHWAGFDKATSLGAVRRLEFAKAAMALFFEADDARFCCHIADRQNGDVTAQFKGHPHAGELAYEKLATRVLGEVIDEEEIVAILADGRSTSPEVDFERAVANTINNLRGCLAVATVCRLDSRSTDALQVVDLLLGATTLDLRQGRTESGSQKQQLLEHLLEHCGCASFRPEGREDPDGRWKVKLLARSRKTRRKRRGR